MKHFGRLLSAFFFAATLFMISSCSDEIGYSVVLWTLGEQNIADGEVVAVYMKSNISKTYLIANPETGERFEVPLWKLTEPVSKRKIKDVVKQYEEYKHTYAMSIVDGLPIRQETKNLSRQIYRLRKNEVIKTLYVGEGEIPTNGREQLDGQWIRVLTSNGTGGWCFSYNLRTFQMNPDGTYSVDTGDGELQETDDLLETVLASKWYPDYYQQMLKNKEVDLNYVKSDYGFDTGAVSGTVTIRVPTLDVSYPFEGVTKTSSGVYKFNETGIQITVRNEGSISVRYTDPSGRPFTNSFITLPQTADEIIEAETSRREKIYSDLKRLGPTYKSSNYGTLTFSGSGDFTWTGFDNLQPAIIGLGARNSGRISADYFLSKTQKASWDGILTFHFGEKETANFFYKVESNGLRLCNAKVVVTPDPATGRSTVDINQPSGATVIFFHK